MTKIERQYLESSEENKGLIIDRFTDCLLYFSFANSAEYLKKLTLEDFKDKASEMFTKKITIYNANEYCAQITAARGRDCKIADIKVGE